MDKFIVKSYDDENLEDLISEDYPLVAYVYDSNEEFLPDYTPDWLYEILNSLDGEYIEHQESIFGMDTTFYNELISHPNCILYK